ncbi:DNA cytosine methyltransferase [Hahella sp. HN01]|uniref:DNA cytosine methyltransferase n=1 Tax=Hahella sp. HN01 TaxID=2847262 RepID=UPI001C1EDE80|nr:DNA (cytosine-5-)-methyltransferase [Hahella sp. HN01]MBU6951103.1 DNA cytosine methyltransferase [Hahella sp. HN01]
MSDKTFIEFFAGIGLMHAGLVGTGWRCEYANDIDPKKYHMYRDRFGDARYYHIGDVWETDEVVERIEQTPLLATASFPCVDLSLAGKRSGLSGDESGTFYGFAAALRGLKEKGRQPKMVLIENVMGFLTANKGRDFQAACQELADLGYWIDAFSVDAKHFVPQSRPRIFILGCLQEALPDGHSLKPDDVVGVADSEWRRRIDAQEGIRPKSVRAALLGMNLATGLFCQDVKDLPSVKTNLRDLIDVDAGEWWEPEQVKKHWNEMSAGHQNVLSELKRQDEFSVGGMYRRVRNGESRTEIRTDGIAGCLRTPRGGSSRQMVFVAGKGKLKMRWMSPVEYARLQGASDFPISVGVNQALFGFGDAVCVPAIEWIARHCLEPIYHTLTLRESRKESIQADLFASSTA